MRDKRLSRDVKRGWDLELLSVSAAVSRSKSSIVIDWVKATWYIPFPSLQERDIV